jgi:hypothetical protein
MYRWAKGYAGLNIWEDKQYIVQHVTKIRTYVVLTRGTRVIKDNWKVEHDEAI